MKVNVSARLAFPYHFSISLTCDFAFRHSAGTRFHVVHARHLALKELSKVDRKNHGLETSLISKALNKKKMLNTRSSII